MTDGITNSGTMYGYIHGIEIGGATLSGSAGLVLLNTGEISAATGSAVRFGGAVVNGDLINDAGGTMTGHDNGLVIEGGASQSGSIVNNGSILGTLVGLRIKSSSVSGNLTNSGLISGSSTALLFSTGATLTGDLTNSGTISGSTNSIDVDSSSSLHGIVIAGNDTARFVGAVQASNTPMSIASGATYTLRSTDDFRVASFTNNGTAQFDSTTPSFSVANVGDQTFHNAGTLKVADGQSATLTGNYDQSGVLSVGASGTSSYGKLTVTGNATLNSGASFDVDVASSTSLVSTNTLTGVLTAGGTLTNNAGTLTVTDNSTLVDFYAAQNGNAVDLCVVAQGATACGASGTYTITGANSKTSNFNLTHGDSLVVASGGSIGSSASSPIYSGISVTGTAGFISNGGSIGGQYVGINQVNSTLNSGLTNSGEIGGAWYGIAQSNSALSGGLTNSGSIHSDRGIYQYKSSLSGGLINSGSIGGRYGIDQLQSTVSGGLINSGTISGIYQQSSTLIGGLTNSGTIAGATYGIYRANSALSGGLTNSGSIGGSDFGIDQEYSTISDGLTNSGTISGGTNSIYVNGGSLDRIVIAGNDTARFVGAVQASNTPMSIASGATYTLRSTDDFRVASFTNNGTAQFDSTTPSFSVANVGDGTFNNAGTLKVADGQTATLTGNYAQSGVLSIGASSASSYGKLTVTGNATLNSGASFDVDVASSNSLVSSNTLTGVLTAGGTLTNNAGTLSVTDNSTLVNFIASQNGNAVDLCVVAEGATTCPTTHTITGANSQTSTFNLSHGDSLVVASDGSINASAGVGVSVTGAAGFISNSGTIGGHNTGLVQYRSTLSGGLTNSGTISSLGTGIYLSQSTLNGGLTNSGTIAGGYDGIFQYSVNLSGGLTNSGTIAGGWYGINQRYSALSGGLTNSRTIAGDYYGILQSHSSINGGLTNSGIIKGNYNNYSGIYQSHSTISGGLTNSGTIAGGICGINQFSSTLSGGLTNSGTIAATGTNTGTVVGSTGTVTGQFAIAVDSTSSLDSIVIAGNDTARFQGIVFADRTPMSIASGATYTLRSTDDFRVASFTNNGTAQFDATTPSFSVANVGDQTFNNAGTLKVADGQTATLTGNYAQSGVLSIGASSASSYGKLNVTGNATLNSGASFNVDVASSNSLVSGNTLTGVLTAGGTLTNNAGTLSVTDNSTLVNFVASQNGNAIDLAVVAQQSSGGSSSGGSSSGGSSSGGSSSGGSSSGGSSSGGSSSGSSTTSTAFTTYVRESGTSGALGAAGTLDGVLSTWLKNGTTGNAGMDKVVSGLIAHSTTKAQVVEDVKETLPLLTGGTTAAASSALGSINKVVQARMDGNRGMSSGDSFFTDRHLWFKPFASWADQADKSGVSGYKSNLAGAAFGGDAVVSDNDRLGAAVAYASADVKSNDANQRAKVDVYQLIGYGSHSIDANTELTYQADIGSNVNRGRRNINFMGTTATSNYRSTSFHLGTGIARTYPLNETTSVTPSLRADYTHVRDGSYSENGAGALNLNVSGRTTEEMLWSADVKLAHKLKDSLTLVANGGLAYDSKAKAASVTAAYAGAPGMGFTTTGIKPDATTFRGGVGLVSTPENGPEITGRYDVERRNGYTNQTVSAKARWVF